MKLSPLKKCYFCGRVITKSQLTSKWRWNNKTKFCSKKCQAKVIPPPLQGKITGKKCQECGKEFFVKGKSRREKQLLCSKNCRKGKRHPMWRGGVTEKNHYIRNSSEYRNWRDSVYRRDFWTCQDCGIKQSHPIAHHIKTFNEYPELRFSVDNGITLCRSCHKKRHQEIGMKTRFKKQIKNS